MWLIRFGIWFSLKNKDLWYKILIIKISSAEIFIIHIKLLPTQNGPIKSFNICKYAVIFSCLLILKVINIHLQKIWKAQKETITYYFAMIFLGTFICI